MDQFIQASADCRSGYFEREFPDGSFRPPLVTLSPSPLGVVHVVLPEHAPSLEKPDSFCGDGLDDGVVVGLAYSTIGDEDILSVLNLFGLTEGI
jgi:hypothetical protein